ncbi:FAD binding domain-containing protein [Streptomyces alkaliphilus]|uniref:FAD binding domain-containing protein n=1 Tax=Streptomyces alkaliphilus TaxID=1472722 RepID=UPI001180E19D|nr:FAD binding domain-containing protein [Streptomyces alkaliphilus]MQS08403.1 xanthine dehydrogenase family protein subunit M [Streptomyces alkaliphilus]
MDFLRPGDWREALALRAERPGALPIAGGTDVMVEINHGGRRPEALLDLSALAELHALEHEPAGEDPAAPAGRVRLGAAVPYSRVVTELGAELPGLALAARTVGSPQIRNRGSVGGNLGAASPAGDCHPALLASGAEIEAVSVRGTRHIPVDDFYLGVKRNALAPDELIRSVRVPRATGPQQFSKVGPRNAMVIAVCAVAVALHPGRGGVGVGIGSAAPTPVRAREAEEYIAGVLADGDLWERRDPIPPAAARRFAELVAAACSPIDDVRGTAAYRRHAVAVMARRTLGWCWEAHRAGASDPRPEGGAPCA